jgi:hypothetical protein
MTPERWRRLQDARRLADMNHTAMEAEENAAEAPRITMNIDRRGQREIARIQSEADRIVGLDEAGELTGEMLARLSRIMQGEYEKNGVLDFAGALIGGGVMVGVDRAGNIVGRQAETRLTGNEGRPVTGRELLASRVQPTRQYITTGEMLRQLVKGNPPVRLGPPDPQDVEAKYYKDKLRDATASCFDRWLDVVDSQGELEDFLWKSYQYGKQFKNEGSMDLDILEGRLRWRNPNG